MSFPRDQALASSRGKATTKVHSNRTVDARLSQKSPVQFYKLEAEVPGGWGPNTVFTRTPGVSLVIHRLHIVFDDWRGDDLLESSPCYLVSVKLANLIQHGDFSGYELKPVEISLSDLFHDLNPGRELPGFAWIEITGTVAVDDFGKDSDGLLIVSGRVLELLQDNCQFQNGTVTPYGKQTGD